MSEHVAVGASPGPGGGDPAAFRVLTSADGATFEKLVKLASQAPPLCGMLCASNARGALVVPAAPPAHAKSGVRAIVMASVSVATAANRTHRARSRKVIFL